MSRFSDNLWQDLVRDHGAALAEAERPSRVWARRASLRLRRPRVLAGGTLGAASVGAIVTLALGAASTAPAFAVTTSRDGSVTVQISRTTDLPQANAKLRAMGINEQVTIQMARGAAPVRGPVQCMAPAPGAGLSGPPVRVLVGTDGTEAFGSSHGTATWHLVACSISS
jgi:hypothetical protein